MQASFLEAAGPSLMGLGWTMGLANDPSQVLPFLVMTLSILLVAFELLRRRIEIATSTRKTFAAGSVRLRHASRQRQGSQPHLSLLHLALEADLGKGEENEDIEGGATSLDLQRSVRRLRRQQRRLRQRLLREGLEPLAVEARAGACIVPCSGPSDEHTETETSDNVEQPALFGLASQNSGEHTEAETSEVAELLVEQPAPLAQEETSSWGCSKQRVYSSHLLLAHRELGLRIRTAGAPGLQPQRLTERQQTPTTTHTASLGGERVVQEAHASSDRECTRPKARNAAAACTGESRVQFGGINDAPAASRAAATAEAAAPERGVSFVYRAARSKVPAVVPTGHMHQRAMGQPRPSKWRGVSDRRTSNAQGCGA